MSDHYTVDGRCVRINHDGSTSILNAFPRDPYHDTHYAFIVREVSEKVHFRTGPGEDPHDALLRTLKERGIEQVKRHSEPRKHD